MTTKVVEFNGKAKAAEQNKRNLLEVLDEMRRQVEEGTIVEFVATSLMDDGECQIHTLVSDLPGGVGLYEIGKHMIIQQEAYGFELD
jgi:hypothetical protein